MKKLKILQIMHDYICMEGGWLLFLQYVESHYNENIAATLDKEVDELLEY